MTELELYRKALERIAKCDEGNLERYCAKVDAIAVDALVKGEILRDEADHKTL